MNKYALVGVALVGVGLAFAAVPDLAGYIDVGSPFLTAAGVLALVQALRTSQARRRTEVTLTKPPTSEQPQELPAPGGELDEALAKGSMRMRDVDGPRRVPDRLRQTAVDVLVQYESMTEEEARRALSEGTWTDDPWAASMFTPWIPPWAPLRVRLSSMLRGQFRQRCAARAAAEIARIAGVTDE